MQEERDHNKSRPRRPRPHRERSPKEKRTSPKPRSTDSSRPRLSSKSSSVRNLRSDVSISNRQNQGLKQHNPSSRYGEPPEIPQKPSLVLRQDTAPTEIEIVSEDEHSEELSLNADDCCECESRVPVTSPETQKRKKRIQQMQLLHQEQSMKSLLSNGGASNGSHTFHGSTLQESTSSLGGSRQKLIMDFNCSFPSLRGEQDHLDDDKSSTQSSIPKFSTFSRIFMRSDSKIKSDSGGSSFCVEDATVTDNTTDSQDEENALTAEPAITCESRNCAGKSRSQRKLCSSSKDSSGTDTQVEASSQHSISKRHGKTSVARTRSGELSRRPRPPGGHRRTQSGIPLGQQRISLRPGEGLTHAHSGHLPRTPRRRPDNHRSISGRGLTSAPGSPMRLHSSGHSPRPRRIHRDRKTPVVESENDSVGVLENEGEESRVTALDPGSLVEIR